MAFVTSALWRECRLNIFKKSPPVDTKQVLVALARVVIIIGSVSGNSFPRASRQSAVNGFLEQIEQIINVYIRSTQSGSQNPMTALERRNFSDFATAARLFVF